MNDVPSFSQKNIYETVSYLYGQDVEKLCTKQNHKHSTKDEAEREKNKKKKTYFTVYFASLFE